MRQLAQVMAFTHQQGITHRDIKPENVLLQDNGNIALCDFGISKDIISGAYESTLNLSAAGPLAYCAPEAGKLQLVQSCNPVYTSCFQMHVYAHMSGVYQHTKYKALGSQCCMLFPHVYRQCQFKKVTCQSMAKLSVIAA